MHISPHTDLPRGIAGGLLIGVSSSAFLLLTGKLSGMSGILASAVSKGEPWRYAYICGLLVAGASLARASPASFGGAPHELALALSPAGTALAGVAVGLGARLGGGCTSGHGVCGLPRFSPRSLLAVATFMSTGALTAWAAAHVGGGGGGGGVLRQLLFSAAPSALVAAPQSLLETALPAVASALLAAAATRGWLGLRAAGSGGAPPSPLLRAPTEAAGVSFVAASFACAVLFGAGLVISGMTDPGKVAGFLNFTSASGWDPSLAGVMGGAVLLNTLTFWLMRKYVATPLLDPHVSLRACAPAGSASAANSRVDWRLLSGAALFGAGWGLAGVCPGPALVSLGAGRALIARVFVPAMLAGVTAHELLAA